MLYKVESLIWMSRIEDWILFDPHDVRYEYRLKK